MLAVVCRHVCACAGEEGCFHVLVWFCTSMSMSKYQVSQEVSHCLHAGMSEALTHVLDPGCVRICVCMWEKEKEFVVSRPL